jgi:hypothetical protein
VQSADCYLCYLAKPKPMMIAVILVGSNIIPAIGTTGLGAGTNGANIGDMNTKHVNTIGTGGTMMTSAPSHI